MQSKLPTCSCPSSIHWLQVQPSPASLDRLTLDQQKAALIVAVSHGNSVMVRSILCQAKLKCELFESGFRSVYDAAVVSLVKSIRAWSQRDMRTVAFGTLVHVCVESASWRLLCL